MSCNQNFYATQKLHGSATYNESKECLSTKSWISLTHSFSTFWIRMTTYFFLINIPIEHLNSASIYSVKQTTYWITTIDLLTELELWKKKEYCNTLRDKKNRPLVFYVFKLRLLLKFGYFKMKICISDDTKCFTW